jgi:ribonucleoside-diphosphate reductase alpha chain
MDYIFQWLSLKFLNADKEKPRGFVADLSNEANGDAAAAVVAETAPQASSPGSAKSKLNGSNFFLNQLDSPPCPECGGIMVRNGACYRCLNCGETSGCS